MGEELTAKETLEVVGKICSEHKITCAKCPIYLLTGKTDCVNGFLQHAKEIAEVCKRWKGDHTPIEVQCAYICRIIEDRNGIKKCVNEVDITDKEMPFGAFDESAEDTLREYCNNHKGKFFATVERIFKPKER